MASQTAKNVLTMPIFKPSQELQAMKHLQECFRKKRHVKVEHIPETKTVNQNRYIWLVFCIIAEDTGNSKEDIYAYYLDKFPVRHLVNGTHVRISMSHPNFTKDVLSHFIDQVVIDARQEGYTIPNPDDIEAKQAIQYYREKGWI